MLLNLSSDVTLSNCIKVWVLVVTCAKYGLVLVVFANRGHQTSHPNLISDDHTSTQISSIVLVAIIIQCIHN